MTARSKRPVVVKQGLEMWVMTYGDMMSLLLTFFVLIVSFSSVRESKFKQAAMALREAFGVLATPESVLEFNQPLVPRHMPTEQSDLLYEVREMEQSLLAEGLEGDLEVEATANGVMVRIAAPVLFASGAAALEERGGKVLAKLAALIDKYPVDVSVEGHTDSVPIATTRYPSNWHLSAGRAVAVAQQLQQHAVAPDRLSATGYGEYRPVADNASSSGRARNRRVEIYLELDLGKAAGNQLPLQQLETEADPFRLDSSSNSPVTDHLGSIRND